MCRQFLNCSCVGNNLHKNIGSFISRVPQSTQLLSGEALRIQGDPIRQGIKRKLSCYGNGEIAQYNCSNLACIRSKTLLEKGSWHQCCFIICSLNFGGWKSTIFYYYVFMGSLGIFTHPFTFFFPPYTVIHGVIRFKARQVQLGWCSFSRCVTEGNESTPESPIKPTGTT